MKNFFIKLTGETPDRVRDDRPGFTLIELLMAITIFMVLLTVSANSFLSIIHNQTSANQVRQIYSDLRSLIDLVNDEMRSGEIDYYCFEPATGTDFLGQSAKIRCSDDAAATLDDGTVLRIISADGLSSSVIFTLPDANDSTRQHVYLRRWRNFDGSWEPDVGFTPTTENPNGYQEILFANVTVKNLSFNILPKVRPSRAQKLSDDLQPMVELNLKVAGSNNFTMDYQTLITSRTYSQ